MDQIPSIEIIANPQKRKSYGRLCDVAKKLRAQTHELGEDCMCLKLKCFKNITLEEQKKLIRDFNNLGTYDAQNIYLSGLITTQMVKRRRNRKRPEEAKFHSFFYKYKIGLMRNGQICDVSVCYKAMISLHGITPRRMQHIQKQITTHGKIMSDGRGKHKNRPHRLKTKTEEKDEHIQSLGEQIQENEFLLPEIAHSKSIPIPASKWIDLQSKSDRQAYVETHSISDQLASCNTESQDYQTDQSNEEGAIQESEQSGNTTGEVVLTDEIKEEVDDDFFAESRDELSLTKEEILTLVTEKNGEKTATVDLVKEELESEDENEPPEKRSRVEFSQVSNDLNQAGPSRVTTDEPQRYIENSTGPTQIEQKELALDNLLTYSGDLEMFFKTILSVAKKLDPVDQVILQRNITNAVFDIKIKEMTNKKS